MKIEPHTLNTFFSDCLKRESQIKIPIYQRKYCWNTKIVKQFHKDLANNGNAFGHHIGKLYFHRRYDGHRMCIDGQQRLTTLLIGICALRDVVFEVNEKMDNFGKVLQEIHSFLFVKQVDLKKIQEEYQSTSDKYGKAGEIAKDVSRLIPSHDDRVSYIEILIGLSGNQMDTTFQNSNMHNTRDVFYKIFKAQISKQEEKSKSGRILSNYLLPILTMNGKFVIVEYDECEINPQHRFGELYNVGKSNQILFHIKTPGIDLSYSDLIKNHLLSKLEECKQLEIYEKYWLTLERKFITNSGHQSTADELSSCRRLDLYLEWYLFFFLYSEKERIEKYAERRKQLEEYERLPLIKKLAMCGKETNFTLYSHFVNGIEKSQPDQLLSSMISHVEIYMKEIASVNQCSIYYE